MSTRSIFSPSDDPLNPPESTGLHTGHCMSSDKPEAVRRSHLAEESYVKAMGILNYLYALFFGVAASAWLCIAIMNASGKVLAPWISQIGWIIYIINLWLMALLSFVAGFGFRRLRPWAIRIEAILSLCWLLSWLLAFVISSRIGPFSGILSAACIYLALATPMLNLWDVRRSVIFDRDYRRVIEETPSIRTRAKLPLELKLIAALFLIVSLVVAYIGAKLEKEKQTGRPAKAAATGASSVERRTNFDCV